MIGGMDLHRLETEMTTKLGTKLNLTELLAQAVQGLAALWRLGVHLPGRQQELIRHLADTGDEEGAREIILAELESQFGRELGD